MARPTAAGAAHDPPLLNRAGPHRHDAADALAIALCHAQHRGGLGTADPGERHDRLPCGGASVRAAATGTAGRCRWCRLDELDSV